MTDQLYSFKLWRATDDMEVTFICYAESLFAACRKGREELDKWNRSSTKGDYALINVEWRDKEDLENGMIICVG